MTPQIMGQDAAAAAADSVATEADGADATAVNSLL